MKQPYSLRRRLAVGLASGFAALWLAGVIVSGLVVRHELDEAFDSALQESAQRLLSLAVVEILDHEGERRERRIAALGPHDEFLTYLVRDRAGAILLRSHDAVPSVFPARPQAGFNDTPTHRIYGESAISETIFIQVAEALDHRREATVEAMLGLVLPLALFVPISVFGVWWLVRRSMRPVINLRSQIERRGAGDLSPLATSGLPEEVDGIAEAVNRLMDRLDRSLQAERSFASNSAHELRTPIAGALAQTQRLLSSIEDSRLRTRVQGIEATLRRLARISEKLMQLARAEGGGVLAEQEVDLGPVLDAVLDEFRRQVGAAARLHYSGAEPGALIARLDADAFGILMRNLIDNALKHSPPDTPVEVRAEFGRVRVINAGPALSPEMLADLTKPFMRGQTPAEGSGLGLAIAQAIAVNASLGLDLFSPATARDDGFEACVTLRAGAGDTVASLSHRV